MGSRICECSPLQGYCQYVFQRGVTFYISTSSEQEFTKSLARSNVARLVVIKLDLTVMVLCIALVTNKSGKYFIF